jgi:uncharacterized protein (TIGR04255 family)
LADDKVTMPSLTLPEPDTTRLTSAPLELVVCQVRHERRLVVADGATALAVHEALGAATGRYPNLDEVTGAEVNFVVAPGAAPSLSETKSSGWRFASSDGTWAVTLMPDHFALETTAYTTWAEDFQPRLAELVDAVAEHVVPTFERRIGLRYIDRITELELTDLAAWEPYLRPELLGLILHPQLGPGVRNSQQQVVIELDEAVSAGVRHGPVVEQGRDVIDYQLDFDVFRQGARGFDAGAIKAAADEFNIYALQLFQASVTDQLLEVLR